MDGRMSEEDVLARLKAAFSGVKDMRVARYVRQHDVDTDEMKVRVEITFTIPRTTKAE